MNITLKALGLLPRPLRRRALLELAVRGGKPAPFRHLFTSKRYDNRGYQFTPADEHYNDRCWVIYGNDQIARQKMDDLTEVGSAEVYAGATPKDELKWMIRKTREVRKRCAPWVDFYLVPRLSIAGLEGEAGRKVQAALAPAGGCASMRPDGSPYIMLATHTSPWGFQGLIHHEVYHQCEEHAHRTLIWAMDAAVSALAEQWGGNPYLGSSHERMAYAYASYANLADLMHEQGLPPPACASGPWAVIYDFFHLVYTGEFAKKLMHRKWAEENGLADEFQPARGRAGLFMDES